jgi:putative ABC transport system permease protein
MEKLFGIPMQSIMVVLLVLLGICLLSVAFIAWRRPVIFKLGVRNIPRRKAQTTLIVVGLMLATLIISAALGTGDTLNYSVRNAAVEGLGPVDELIVYNNNPDEDANIAQSFLRTIPEDSVQKVRDVAEGNDDIDGVAGLLLSRAPFINVGFNDPTGLTDMESLSQIASGSEPGVSIAGLNQESIDSIGGVNDLDGNAINVDELGDSGVYLNEGAADDLAASTGDTLVFFIGNEPFTATVAGVLPDTVITGTLSPGQPGALMALSRLQQLTGQEGQISAVAVSNSGDAEGGLSRSEDVTTTLNEALADDNLGAVPIKQDNVELAELVANIFVTFFIVFGLFSIGVGILLIVLIFTMLAAERRAEMGMTRAVGAQRRQLIQQFLSEGAGYTLLSGIVGTALGVLAAWGISQAFKALLGDEFDITPHFEPRSLIIAYCLGVVITFLAVAISSWRVSRLNIVAAVRDIPDAYVAKRNRKQLIWSIVMIVAGGLLLMTGVNAEQQAPFTIGFTLIPFGLAGILTYFGMKSRPVLTIAGLITLVFWLLPEDIFSDIFGEFNGNIEMFFVSGICIVAASTLIIVQNLDSILSLVEHLGSRVKGFLLASRLAVAYPGANKGRTGMTIAMFSLIVFSLVMIAAINSNFTAAFLNDKAYAGWDVRVDVAEENPVDDFQATLESTGVDTSQIESIGRIDLPNQGGTQFIDQDGEWSQLDTSTMNDAWIDGSGLTFQAHATGYDSDEAIIEALKTEPDVMVISSGLAEGAPAGGFGEPVSTMAGTSNEGTFEAPTVTLQTEDDQERQVRVIGVLNDDFSMLFGAYMGTTTSETLFPANGPNDVSYYIHVAEGASADDVARDIEVKLLPFGAVATDLEQQMKDDQSTQQSFMYVLQGFMGLGLIVGIAAVGVIAYRAVVERRQQIGMLRALGVQRRVVQQAFVLESTIIVILGVLAGAVFGLILAYTLMTSDSFTEGAGSSVSFIVPWDTILVTLSLSIVAALLMAWVPARQASRVIPAEALRYE